MTLVDPQRMCIATPYPEGATLAIARAAVASGVLERFITPLLPTWARHAPVRQLAMRAGARRSQYAAIPEAAAVSAGSFSELVRVAARLAPGADAIASAAMYWAKRRFDVGASRLVGQSEVVIGVYGSAAETLRVARSRGALTILNFVNSHPRVQNAALAAARVPSSWEYVPARVARAVDRELETADIVLVPSRFVARQLTDAGIPGDRLAVVSYGVDLDTFSQRGERREARPRLQVLFLGQVSYRKGVAVLVETARHLGGEIDLKIVGPVVSPGLLRNLPPNVRYRKTVGRGELPSLLNTADVFVLPSLEDAYPLASLEAMATGLPVVVSDQTGTSELIQPWKNGAVVGAGDVDSLVDALRTLRDVSLRQAMGRAARATVEQGHSWHDYGARVLELVEQRRAA